MVVVSSADIWLARCWPGATPLGEWHQIHTNAENIQSDLSLRENSLEATMGVSRVYNLACDMGGMGFIEGNRALCMLSSLISTHMLLAARDSGVERFFYASSACVYAAANQTSSEVTPLRESDAYPAMPEDGYGWEKLFSERMARHFREDFGLDTCAARFHNVYGPHGAYEGGREKAPAALCRKVAAAVMSGRHEIEIWGDGQQTRSFMYIDDCIHGIDLIVQSDLHEPINVGSSELVTIDGLVDLIEEIAGVRGRNSDNALIEKILGWSPSIGLREGLEPTYRWIYDQLKNR